MTLKSIPYKWTYLVGVALLGSLLWSGTFRDGLLDFAVILLFVCFLVSAVVSLVLAVTCRTRSTFYGVVVNIIVALLLVPTMNLGGHLRDRVFLMHLSRFQEVTDVLIRDEKRKSVDSESMVQLPPNYSNLNVLDKVQISLTRGNITVRYFNRDSSALGHSGYMYRSDDDPVALEKDYPKTGYTRVAPHWFYFAD